MDPKRKNNFDYWRSLLKSGSLYPFGYGILFATGISALQRPDSYDARHNPNMRNIYKSNKKSLTFLGLLGIASIGLGRFCK